MLHWGVTVLIEDIKKKLSAEDAENLDLVLAHIREKLINAESEAQCATFLADVKWNDRIKGYEKLVAMYEKLLLEHDAAAGLLQARTAQLAEANTRIERLEAQVTANHALRAKESNQTYWTFQQREADKYQQANQHRKSR